MKKLITVLFVISCCILTACATAPQKISVKDEAVKFEKEYCQQAVSIHKAMDADNEKIWKEYGSDWTNDPKIGAMVTEKYKPQIDNLVNKFNSEKVENQSVKDLISKKLKVEQDIINMYASFTKVEGMSNTQYDEYSKECMFNWGQTFNLDLEYKNEYSLLVNNKSTYELTLANFKKIHKGDIYMKVANTFKMPGKLSNSMESNSPLIGNRLLEVYEWNDGDAYVKIMFENGKAYQLEQRNLK